MLIGWWIYGNYNNGTCNEVRLSKWHGYSIIHNFYVVN